MTAAKKGEWIVTVVLLLCAVATTATVLRREFRVAAVLSAEQSPVRAVSGWRSYAQGSTLHGSTNAPVTIVEFSDFQCPFCDSVRTPLAEVAREFPGQVRVVYRHLPLTTIHSEARNAAVAAECAGEQGRFVELHDELFANARHLGSVGYERLAERAGVANLERFRRCLADEKPKVRLRADSTAAAQLGIRGTPALLINGRLVVGAISSRELSEHVRAELEATASAQ